MRYFIFVLLIFLLPVYSHAQPLADPAISIAGIPLEFLFFGLTLVGIAIFHKHTLWVALTGLVIITLYKLLFNASFDFIEHLSGEKMLLFNLLGLLLGFTLLAKHFEQSGIPDILPNYLPDNWMGGFVLLLLIAFIASFLDNIAAAMIGGTIASVVYKRNVHIGYLAAIVAASNAGGAGSVVGDTTTTMMWLAGISPLQVLPAYIAAFTAVAVFGIVAAKQQHKLQPIEKDASVNTRIDGKSIIAVILIPTGAILTNIYFELPAAGVWAAILVCALFTKTRWKEIPGALPGSLFLLALVLSASMMPAKKLPEASWQTTLSLGFVSAVFDNIPLTALAIKQNGYDWGILAYAVGFGGSMVWFGSSAGVVLSNMYPEAKSVTRWLKYGWHIILGYVIGFFVLLALLGWHPQVIKNTAQPPNDAQPVSSK